MLAVAANGNTNGSAQAARRLHVVGWPEAAVGSLRPVAKASELKKSTVTRMFVARVVPFNTGLSPPPLLPVGDKIRYLILSVGEETFVTPKPLKKMRCIKGK